MQKIKKGISRELLIIGLIIMITFISLFLMAILYGYTFSIGGVLLSRWVIYIISALALPIGIYMIKSAFRSLKCGSCFSIMKYGKILFPLPFEKQILEFYHFLDSSVFNQIPIEKESADENITLILDFCPKCSANGIITIEKKRIDPVKKKYQSVIIGNPKIINKDTISHIIPLVEESWRLEKLDLNRITH